jgi:hypothetical protein
VDFDPNTIQLYNVTGSQFFSFTKFWLTIEPDQIFFYHQLGMTTTLSDRFEFQKLYQLDKFIGGS